MIEATPRKPRSTHSSSYISGCLNTRRSALVDDNPVIPVVPLDFFETVTPTVPEELVQNVIQTLKESGRITTQGRVSGFPQDPKERSSNETAIFRNAHNFTQAVMNAGAKCLGQSSCLQMSYNPNSTPWGERANTSRPDGYWSNTIERQYNGQALRQQPNDWGSIILAQENKVSDAPDALRDNYRKVLWSGHQILRNDPRRNFAFGMTTENTNCRFWFFARSHIMASEPFQFITDYAPLVRFVLSLSFAHVLSQEKPNYQHAWQAHGYDPTMERLDEKGTYRIGVGDKWYITKRTLSDFRAESICGRCTRVWEVFEEGKPEITYALKDVWVDRNNDTEASIWLRLKEKVNPDVFSKHFLTLVQASEDDIVTTCSFLKRSNYTPAENVAFMESKITNTLNLTLPPSADPDEVKRTRTFAHGNRVFIRGAPESESPGTIVPTHRRPSYFPRKHDRCIWKEVGTTYHDEENIKVMLQMLEHTVKALHAMWDDAKAIHRDISSGNIFYDGLYGRLGDLEFVKFVEDADSVHDVKTGTAEFMAVEVAASQYLFEPHIQLSTQSVLSQSPVQVSVEQRRYPFRHNILHDLESIWWLVLWTIFRHYPDGLEFDQEVLQRQFSSYLTLFPGPCGNDMQRERAFINDLNAIAYSKNLAPPFAAIGTIALKLRHVLVSCYVQAEAHLLITPDCDAFQDIHQATIVLIQNMTSLMVDSNLEKVVTVNHLLRVAKRKAKEMEDTEEALEDAPPQKKSTSSHSER